MRALGLGTALAIARSASASWHHALVEKQCPAYLSSPFLPARTSGGSRGNCYNSNRHAESLGVLSRTPSPASAMTMSSSDRGQGNQGTFGGGDGHQKGPPPAGGASSAGREAHAASRRAGPLKATSVLLHDEPVRTIIQYDIMISRVACCLVGSGGQVDYSETRAPLPREKLPSLEFEASAARRDVICSCRTQHVSLVHVVSHYPLDLIIDHRTELLRMKKKWQTFFGGRQPVTSRAARWFIRRAIDSRAIWYEGLKVEVEARSNREAIRGRFDTVSVEFGKMGFPTIQVRKDIQTPRRILALRIIPWIQQSNSHKHHIV